MLRTLETRLARRVSKNRLLSLAALAPLLAFLLAGCGQQAGAWRLLTPSGAHIFSLATDPHNPKMVFAGADQGGVYLARADQTGLAVSTKGIPDQTVVASILPDPKIAGRIFAGTSRGLYRSADYGGIWAPYGKGLPGDSSALALAATPDDTTLLAGLDGAGISRSQDDGATWTPSGFGLPAKANVVSLAWDASAHLWWAGLDAQSGPALYASADGGATWLASVGLPLGASVNGLVILDGSGGETRIAATSAGLYTQRSGASAWSKITTGLPSGGSLAIAPIAGQPEGVVAAIVANVYYSADAGRTWNLVAQGLTNNVLAVTVAQDGHGKNIYYAASGQLARYPNSVTPNDPFAYLALAILAGLLIVGGYFLMRRNRRFGYAMGANANETNAGPGAAADRARLRQQRGDAPSSPFFQSFDSSVSPDDAKSDEVGAARVLSPADLTTRERTGTPAAPGKAAQNGHGKPKRKKR